MKEKLLSGRLNRAPEKLSSVEREFLLVDKITYYFSSDCDLSKAISIERTEELISVVVHRRGRREISRYHCNLMGFFSNRRFMVYSATVHYALLGAGRHERQNATTDCYQQNRYGCEKNKNFLFHPSRHWRFLVVGLPAVSRSRTIDSNQWFSFETSLKPFLSFLNQRWFDWSPR